MSGRFGSSGKLLFQHSSGLSFAALRFLGSFELMVPDPRITARRDRSLEDQQTGVLVHRCLAGDAAAWEGIVRLFNKRIYNLCTGLPILPMTLRT